MVDLWMWLFAAVGFKVALMDRGLIKFSQNSCMNFLHVHGMLLDDNFLMPCTKGCLDHDLQKLLPFQQSPIQPQFHRSFFASPALASGWWIDPVPRQRARLYTNKDPYPTALNPTGNRSMTQDKSRPSMSLAWQKVTQGKARWTRTRNKMRLLSKSNTWAAPMQQFSIQTSIMLLNTWYIPLQWFHKCLARGKWWLPALM